MKLKTIIIIVLAVLILIIFLQNTQVVTLRFLFWKMTISRIILIPLFVFIGFVIGYVAAKVKKNSSKA
jgi:putative membrane protein